jgi:WD40 repeat protein
MNMQTPSAKAVFDKALEIQSPAERQAYLDAECAEAPTLRQKVEALLKAYAEAGSFLESPVLERVAVGARPPVDLTEAAGLSPPADPAAAPGPACADPGETEAEPSGSGGANEFLAFLAPSEKPGALGRLGHYEVLEVIGRGGMGVVLKAFDEVLHRVVAIKVMAPQLATSATARKRFVREAQAAAAVRNEHVIDIHAVEEAKDVPYLVMEYISGISLQERLDRTGPLALKEILRIGIQTAAGLAAAHSQGLVHRDVKPANILLENGVERVKLTDFGLARAVDDASLTQSGLVAGTPQYMAPEQAGGQAIDRRADLFSLGSVLYALCTGRPPFRASGTMAVLKRVCEDKPRPIAEINPDIPDWLVALIARLHAKNPAERFQSAAEVAALLSQHLAEVQQPALAPLPSLPSTLPLPPAGSGNKGGGRRRWAVAAAVLLVVLGGLGLTEATGVTQVADTVLRVFTPEGTLVVEVDDPSVQVTIEGDGGLVITGAGPQEVRLRPGSYRLHATKDGQPVKQEVVTITRGGKQVVRVSLEPAGPARVASSFRFESPPPGPLDRLDPAGIPATERFDWQPKQLVAVLGEHRQRQWAPVPSVAWSADGKRIASGGRDGVIRVWDAETMREQAVLHGHTRAVMSVAISHDGRHILSASWDATVRWWDVETATQLRRFDDSAQVDCVALTPDGRRFLSGNHSRLIRLWDLETGAELRRFEGHTYTIGAVAFSRDGRRVLSGGYDYTVRLWDVESAKQLHRLQGHTGQVRAVAFSPNGRLALSGNLYGTKDNRDYPPTDCDLRLWDVETGRELRRFQGHESLVEGVAFSPDNQYALSCSWDGTLRWWDVATGKELRRFVGKVGPLHCVALSPDGRRAVSGGQDGCVRLWDVASGKEVRPVTGPTGLAYQVAFSPDGSHLLAAGVDQIVRLWDIGLRKEPRRFEGHTDPVISVALSPDGRRALSASCTHLPFVPQPANSDRTTGPWRLWDVPTGKEIRRFSGPSTLGAGSAAFSPDGRRALTSCRSQLLLWDVDSGHQLGTLPGHPGSAVVSVAFSPDGRRALSAGGDGTVRLWQVDISQELRCFRGHTGSTTSVAFSPDGRHGVSGGYDGTVRLWDLDADQSRGRVFVKWHTDRVRAVAFGPDGKRLASAGEEGRIILWDVAAGDKLRQWQLPGPVCGVAFAADGRHLATANGNGTVYILRLTKR